MIPQLVHIIVNLNDVLFLLLYQCLQFFQVILIDVSETIGLKLLYTFVFEPIDYTIDLLSFR